MFLRIKSQGYIFSESVNQLLCENCNRFLADRFVEGICPDCKYEDARGDQCDGCGHLINATELIKPRCKVCSKTPIVKASTQFFLDLPKVSKILILYNIYSLYFPFFSLYSGIGFYDIFDYFPKIKMRLHFILIIFKKK